MSAFYNRLPVLLQNLLVTLKNISVYNYKYGAIPLISPINKIQKDVLNKSFMVNDSKNLIKINNFLKYVTSKSFYYKKNL